GSASVDDSVASSHIDEEIKPRRGNEGKETDLVIIRREAEFLSLRWEWNELVDRCPVSIYQTFDWQWFWWKHYGGKNSLYIATFRSRADLIGIIPMFFETFSIAHKELYRRLRMMGAGVASNDNLGLPGEYGPSDYLDAIVTPGYESSVAEQFSTLVSSSDEFFDELEFRDVPRDSVLRTHIFPALERAHLRCRMVEGEVCPYLTTPGSTSEFMQNLHPNIRHRLRQAKKEFTAHIPFHIETPTIRTEVTSAFVDLIHLHQCRWNSLGYAGLFSDRRFKRFQNDIVRAFHDRGWLWLKAVHMGGVRTAVRMGFFFKNRYYDYLSGFDATLPGANKRPSLALLLAVIEDAVEHGAAAVDFLRGDEAYKFELSTECSQNVNISARSRWKFRQAPYWIALFGHTILRLVLGETKLIAIHYQSYGWRTFALKYGKFIWLRLKRKTIKRESK
ncbi:MAG TPA: GNAT family N-acetyltransferase, partial [Bacteroidota bacterium]|nr:GNAT family N-acetyltransferase [Bacteroidota bacterium]